MEQPFEIKWSEEVVVEIGEKHYPVFQMNTWAVRVSLMDRETVVVACLARGAKAFGPVELREYLVNKLWPTIHGALQQGGFLSIYVAND